MSRRAVLENVPKVAFAPIHDGRFEFTPFPSCLKAITGYVGAPVTYHYVLSTSGAAFRLLWHRERWEGGNVDIRFMDEDPLRPFTAALSSLGYEYEIILNGTMDWEIPHVTIQKYLSPHFVTQPAGFRDAVVESINAGRPVLAFGVVGPPEASIIAGYDDGGDVLVGWSMFQEHLDPVHDTTPESGGMFAPAGTEESGYFRQTDWFRKTYGLITLGKRTEVDVTQVYLDTLKWVAAIVRTPTVHNYYSGLRACDEYIAKMLADDEFPSGDVERLAERKMVHYDAMTMIAERGDGATFLSEVSEHPAFSGARKELFAASQSMDSAAKQMGAWWQVAGRIWSDEAAQIRATADPSIRRAFVPYIEKARDCDRVAADRIEEALSKLEQRGGSF